MQIVTIVGARPQFVKAAPLSVELRKTHQEYLIHTGQHYDALMSGIFFHELDLPQPDRNLNVGSGNHGAQTAAILAAVEAVLLEIKPDLVLVYGDTNSTVAGALAAAKLNISVAHVEAGLRSFDRSMPEEINRIVTDHVSTLLFAPSAQSAQQLANEGIESGVHEVGDIMADCVRHFSQISSQRSNILQQYGLEPGAYGVATVHRASNTNARERLLAILQGLSQAPLPVIFPVHPRTRAAIERFGLQGLVAFANENGRANAIAHNAHVRPIAVDPLGYLDMLELTRHAALVLTDSGGLQKEAYFFGVPCVTLRDETEWVETVEAGWNCLVGADEERIGTAATKALKSPPRDRPQLYGDGYAAKRIADALGDFARKRSVAASHRETERGPASASSSVQME